MKIEHNDHYHIIKNLKHPFLDPDLKIFNLLKNYSDICYFDFDFTLMLSITNSKFDRGRKYERYYSIPNDISDLYVKKTYTDIIGNRNINGTDNEDMLLGVEIKIEWYKNDNTLDDHFKTTKSWFTRGQAGEYLIKRRRRNIDNLKGMADKTPAKQYLVVLFNHYKNEVDEYIEVGNDNFKNAIINETDTSINNILNITFPSVLINKEASIKEIILSQV